MPPGTMATAARLAGARCLSSLRSACLSLRRAGGGCVHVRTAAAAEAGVPRLRAGTRSLESGNLSTMVLAEPIPD